MNTVHLRQALKIISLFSFYLIVHSELVHADPSMRSVQIIATSDKSDEDEARTEAGIKFHANCEKVCGESGGDCHMVTDNGTGKSPTRVTGHCETKSGTMLIGTCVCLCAKELQVPPELDKSNCKPMSFSAEDPEFDYMAISFE